MSAVLATWMLALSAFSVIDLLPEHDAPSPIGQAVYVMVDESNSLTVADAVKAPDAFRRNTDTLVNPGATHGAVWVRLDVANQGDSVGTWVLSLNRFALAAAEIHLVDSTGTHTLLADSVESFNESFAEFSTLAASFTVPARGSAQLFVRYRGANWSGLDLSLTTRATLRKEMTTNLLVFFLLLGGIGSLVIYGSISFAFLGRQFALLYALAQIAFFTFYAHMGGFTTVYLWPHTPHLGRIVAPMAMTVFVIAMTEFARHFFDTDKDSPRLDRSLRTLVGAGCVAIVMLPLDYLVPQFDPRIALFLVYAVTLLAWVVLPCIAIHAAFARRGEYWPIAIAWSSMGIFLISLILVFTGVIATIPFGKHAYGVMVYIEAFFVALAIALRIRRIRDERERIGQQLSESLKTELQSSQRAMQLAEDREWAIRDLAEKGRLLLAAGHDTRQMLSALRHFSFGLQRLGINERIGQAGREIYQIADSLDEVLSTAIEGSSSGGMRDDVLALERLRPAQILLPLKLIHGSVALEKGIELRVRTTDQPIVTDRVLVSRVLGNFVSNAIKCTGSGKVLLACRRSVGGHRFQVHDTGMGLHEDALAQLLDPETGAVHFGDMADAGGHGFPISRQLAARLGARISGRSRPGAGSMFELYLPHEASPSAAGAIDEIVLADGDAAQRDGIVKLARDLDIKVRIARPDAAPLMLAGATRARLVLIDQHFGGTDQGIAYARRLGTCPGNIAIAVLTFDRSIDVRMSISKVSHLMLYKPVTEDLLTAALRRAATLIAQRSAATPAASSNQ